LSTQSNFSFGEEHCGLPKADIFIADPPFGLYKADYSWDKAPPTYDEWCVLFMLLRRSHSVADDYSVHVYVTPKMIGDVVRPALDSGCSDNFQCTYDISDERTGCSGSNFLASHIAQPVLVFFWKKDGANRGGTGGGRVCFVYDFTKSEQDKEGYALMLSPVRYTLPVVELPLFLASLFGWHKSGGSTKINNKCQKPVLSKSFLFE
jgi:hypothetical protein